MKTGPKRQEHKPRLPLSFYDGGVQAILLPLLKVPGPLKALSKGRPHNAMTTVRLWNHLALPLRLYISTEDMVANQGNISARTALAFATAYMRHPDVVSGLLTKLTRFHAVPIEDRGWVRRLWEYFLDGPVLEEAGGNKILNAYTHAVPETESLSKKERVMRTWASVARDVGHHADADPKTIEVEFSKDRREKQKIVDRWRPSIEALRFLQDSSGFEEWKPLKE